MKEEVRRRSKRSKPLHERDSCECKCPNNPKNVRNKKIPDGKKAFFSNTAPVPSQDHSSTTLTASPPNSQRRADGGRTVTVTVTR